MQFSDRFLNLVHQQLNSFENDAVLENVVVYIAQSNEDGDPTLEVVGQIPRNRKKVLPPIANDPDLRVPSPNRRWYPLQDGSVLLGVLRAERFSSEQGWPDVLDNRLQASANALSNYLSLELDRKRLLEELSKQREQVGMLVHQLKNPLAALKTYAQLLLRKLGPDSSQRSLVEGLITEQKQFDKYLIALDQLSNDKAPSKALTSARLQLPPLLTNAEELDLRELLQPLIDRAFATSKLQGRKWVGPVNWPDWSKETRPALEAVIAEIVANLLENAFRYSPAGVSLGMSLTEEGICVWDSGDPIPLEERDQIFFRGFRSQNNPDFHGTGLGLALGKELAEEFGGELYLETKPNRFDASLPNQGNAFILKIPSKKIPE